MPYRLSARAERQLAKILDYSETTYGSAAAGRYELLLIASLEVAGSDPDIMSSRAVPGVSRARSLAIRHCKNRLPPDVRVGNPWHQIVYRQAPDGMVEILAVVGESMPAERAIRQR